MRGWENFCPQADGREYQVHERLRPRTVIITRAKDIVGDYRSLAGIYTNVAGLVFLQSSQHIIITHLTRTLITNQHSLTLVTLSAITGTSLFWSSRTKIFVAPPMTSWLKIINRSSRNKQCVGVIQTFPFSPLGSLNSIPIKSRGFR